MLRIAVQSKGRLFEETISIITRQILKSPLLKEFFSVQSSNFPIEVFFFAMMIFLSRWLVEWLI